MSPTKRTLKLRSAGQSVELCDRRVVRVDLAVYVGRERVVLAEQGDVRAVDVRWQLTRGVLREDRVDLPPDDRRLRLGCVQPGALRREARVQRVPLRDARIGRRCWDVGEAHRAQLALREAIRAALEAAADEAGHRMRHEAVLIDTLEERVGDPLEPVPIGTRAGTEAAPDVAQLVEGDR